MYLRLSVWEEDKGLWYENKDFMRDKYLGFIQISLCFHSKVTNLIGEIVGNDLFQVNIFERSSHAKA